MGISYTEIKELSQAEVGMLVSVEMAQNQREQDSMNARKGQMNARGR